MVTIAIGQVFYFIAYRWNSVTGGDDGLSGWQRQPVDLGPLHLDILHDDKVFYFVVLAAFALGCVFGVLAMLPSWWRHRRVARRHAPAGERDMSTDTSQLVLPTLSPEHPPRDGL